MRSPSPTHALLAVAALVLAYEPAKWLLHTWLQPGFHPAGLWIFGLWVALFAWSASSPLRDDAGATQLRVPIALFASTALIRVVGQLLLIDVLGGVALAVDAFALASLARLDQRVRAVSPSLLAFVFALSLPLERILQRVVGYPLQDIAARGACGVLHAGFSDVECHGLRLVVDGADVFVDLPCSGARGLVVLLVAFGTLGALARPGWRQAVTGVFVTTLSALATNTLRVAILSAGIARPALVGGLDLTHGWPHELVGIIALAIGVLPLRGWASRVDPKPIRDRAPRQAPTGSSTVSWRSLALASAAVVAALGIVSLRGQAYDISQTFDDLALPASVGDAPGIPRPLSALETDAYVQHGGSVVRQQYDDVLLLAIQTSAPLRHLHDPEECLRATGYTPTRLGVDYTPYPSALYAVRAPDGRRYRVAVSYLSDDGHVATSVAEVVWHWLRSPETVWTEYQRVAPWDTPLAPFDEALGRALDWTSPLDSAGDASPLTLTAL